MAVDLVGYSALAEADEEAAMTAIDRLRIAIDAAAAREGGRLFNTAGDGFLLEFDSAAGALAAADQLCGAGVGRGVRIGVHLGDVTMTPSGDLLGHGVNVAARLQQAAAPNSVLVSIDVQRAVSAASRTRLKSCGLLQLDKMSGALETFVLGDGIGLRQSAALSRAREEERAIPWIEVLPFETRGDDAELADLAVSLHEDVASGLSKFPYLLVARGTAGSPTGRGRGFNYALEATLRRGGGRLRIVARLVERPSGAVIWTETYDRDFEKMTLFETQDDITDHLVSSVADPYGGLMRVLAGPVALKSPEEMTPYEAILRHFIYRQRIGPTDHLVTRTALERAVELDPGNANAHAALAQIVIEEHKHDFNHLPKARDRALKSARYALDLDAKNASAAFALAEVSFFRQDLGAFRAAAERAIALNPRDSDSMAMIGIMMGYAGHWERAVAHTDRAMQLNRNHPGWYRFATFFNAYRQGNYEEALDIAQRINMPAYFADPYARAMAHGQLGHVREAEAAAAELRAIWPGDLATFKAKHLDIWIFAQPALVALIIDGLQKAGLHEIVRA